MDMQANTVGTKKAFLTKDIYVIKNRVNNKVYVGQSVNPGLRFITHCKPSADTGRCLIAEAIQKYGANNFWYEILESQVENYNEREQYWIEKLNSLAPNGYNIMDGGDKPPTYHGIEHPFSRFSDMNQVEQLKEELRTTNKSLSQIAASYGVSKRTVLRINQGLHYEKLGETYPLRAIPNKNGKLSEEQVFEIIDILKYTYRQYEDIAKQYGISDSVIRKMNLGEVHRVEGIIYPIRKYKNSGRPACTYEQVTEINDLLMNTSISCNQIAKIFNIDVATVYLINNGNAKRYRRDELNYPLRKR